MARAISRVLSRRHGSEGPANNRMQDIYPGETD
jgi:hypothetical protein